MKRNNLIFVFCYIGLCGAIVSQTTSIPISIYITFGDDMLTLSDSIFQVKDSGNLQIELVKFYISNIQFLKNEKVVLDEKNSFHLVDASIGKPHRILVETRKNLVFDAITFYLGIDSLNNVSGAIGGELDPTKGMYWTWQNGYINFKLEGKSNLCKTRNHSFQFHLGGYRQPFYNLQTVRLPIQKQNNINIKLDIKKIFNQINLETQNSIMSPNKDAVMLSKILAGSFSIDEK